MKYLLVLLLPVVLSYTMNLAHADHDNRDLNHGNLKTHLSQLNVQYDNHPKFNDDFNHWINKFKDT